MFGYRGWQKDRNGWNWRPALLYFQDVNNGEFPERIYFNPKDFLELFGQQPNWEVELPIRNTDQRVTCLVRRRAMPAAGVLFMENRYAQSRISYFK